jgi:bifunctional DNA-binding transcriptional regulator/antitoxin component of YhaV-PrlF toxin-antitoxin module
MGAGQALSGGHPVAGVAKMQSRGQFTVPEAVRTATGAKPGSTLLVRQTGDDRFEVIVLPKHTAREFCEAMALRDDLTLAELREGVAESIALRTMPHGMRHDRSEVAASRDPDERP